MFVVPIPRAGSNRRAGRPPTKPSPASQSNWETMINGINLDNRGPSATPENMIGLGLVDEIGALDASAARLVDHGHRLAEVLGGHLRPHPGDPVGAAAGFPRDDQPDRFLGIRGLRIRRANDLSSHGDQNEYPPEPFFFNHGFLLGAPTRAGRKSGRLHAPPPGPWQKLRASPQR